MHPRLPLAGWADAQLRALAEATGAPALARLSGEALMAERALTNSLLVPGPASTGGGCRFYRTKDGWVALNLSRADDRTLLPALFGCEFREPADRTILEALCRRSSERELVARGRLLGLAIAGLNETPASPAIQVTSVGAACAAPSPHPLVLDLTALWAGPLAGRLLALADGEVWKIESPARPDPLRASDPAHYAALNGGKGEVAIDLRSGGGRSQLLEWIGRADIVLEAARPRALRQLGIDADALVRSRPGLTWVTITGHGVAGEAGDWIAFGDDAGVAAGLSRALLETTASVGFVGDAIADPLSGMAAARAAWAIHRAGGGRRAIVSMSGVAGEAMATERDDDDVEFRRRLSDWAAARGTPIRALLEPLAWEAAPC